MVLDRELSSIRGGNRRQPAVAVVVRESLPKPIFDPGYQHPCLASRQDIRWCSQDFCHSDGPCDSTRPHARMQRLGNRGLNSINQIVKPVLCAVRSNSEKCFTWRTTAGLRKAADLPLTSGHDGKSAPRHRRSECVSGSTGEQLLISHPRNNQMVAIPPFVRAPGRACRITRERHRRRFVEIGATLVPDRGGRGRTTCLPTGQRPSVG